MLHTWPVASSSSSSPTCRSSTSRGRSRSSARPTDGPGPPSTRSRPCRTSAGVTAGMDLALALVEEDLGADVARDVARWLVLFVQRPGGQTQFSVQLAARRPDRAALREVEGWIAQHVDGDLSVPVLARQA